MTKLEILNNSFLERLKVTVKIGEDVVTRRVYNERFADLFIWYKGYKLYAYDFNKGYVDLDFAKERKVNDYFDLIRKPVKIKIG